eukprot:5580592-Ditylum_brightwellii.AAC.1
MVAQPEKPNKWVPAKYTCDERGKSTRKYQGRSIGRMKEFNFFMAKVKKDRKCENTEDAKNKY